LQNPPIRQLCDLYDVVQDGVLVGSIVLQPAQAKGHLILIIVGGTNPERTNMTERSQIKYNVYYTKTYEMK
jgi:hypothetical protein